jgi:hypothetical protein
MHAHPEQCNYIELQRGEQSLYRLESRCDEAKSMSSCSQVLSCPPLLLTGFLARNVKTALRNLAIGQSLQLRARQLREVSGPSLTRNSPRSGVCIHSRSNFDPRGLRIDRRYSRVNQISTHPIVR